MRKNLPVTTNEYPITDETLIVSRTDLKGRLTYFNEQFVDAAGFTPDELMGQPHNIIRHPDMPPAAFANLWDTLKQGKPWAGAVKNRRKNGDFYWVLATASAIRENGEITGYTSIRTKLPADQRAEAEKVYGLLNENKAQDYAISAGVIRRRSVFDRLSFFTGTVRARLTTLAAVLSVFMLVIGAAGLLSTRSSNIGLKSMYEDRTVPLAQLFEINDRVLQNMSAQQSGAINGKAGKSIDGIAPLIEENSVRITKLWADYMASYLTPEERSAADAYAIKRKTYLEEGIKPALALLQQRKFDEASQHIATKGHDLFEAAKHELDKLVAIQVKEAKGLYEEAEGQYYAVISLVAALILAGIGLGALFSLQTIRAVLRPVKVLNEAMQSITAGKLDNRIPVERDDEIGEALRHLQTVQSIVRFNSEEVKAVQRTAEAKRKAGMSQLATEFESAIGGIVQTVSTASSQLETSAGTLSSSAARSQELATTVAAASEQASTNVQSVASATEELTSSVTEISRQVQESARIATGAVEQARVTNDRVNELSKAAARIGDVVELINTIAGQTNLLALNATIEAARAGDAGRGFAVVASEVKALAEQTSKATGEIAQQISGIQSATQESVSAIKEISTTIERLSEISSTIAAAVEQQGAATQEISRNIQEASRGTTEVNTNIVDVQHGAAQTGSASGNVLSAAQSLSQESDRLRQEVNRFLSNVRAA
ncbi:putative methyl-accepting chemotaxis protein with PAS domain [Bradyrhizobium sp. ORS 285]|uniref:methyl-accepting chemotaxis protein n=1 Tax=Bradyrhizobium sp. ORS 285 TaxID=115808 RepID=UPI0002406285|nr:methyl-accepting chemotaxis protein [Bradyrhizobium sp. ORS 285]CCD89503.1 putative methyl-accepting chemotaxis protein with PAS domain [Bradyrhizobium sp. ORS 285]SMX58750.1 putative methyl-accepting chemotaxis protein with PAS domain [Bradyrhizobium sp. ORS 285]